MLITGHVCEQSLNLLNIGANFETQKQTIGMPYTQQYGLALVRKLFYSLQKRPKKIASWNRATLQLCQAQLSESQLHVAMC